MGAGSKESDGEAACILVPSSDAGLTASAKSDNVTERTPIIPVCKRFLRRRCTFGDTCKFLHPESEKLKIMEELEAAETARLKQARLKQARRKGNHGNPKVNGDANDINADVDLTAQGNSEVPGNPQQDSNSTLPSTTSPPAALADGPSFTPNVAQCRYVIHGQRRCQRASLTSESGYCETHARLAVVENSRFAMTDEGIKVEGPLDSEVNGCQDELVLHGSKRTSASHKRMTNPASVVKPPPALTFGDLAVNPAPCSQQRRSLIVDIGCAKGRWGLEIATKHANTKHVIGLELREDLVKEANAVAPPNAEFRAMNCKAEGHWKALLGNLEKNVGKFESLEGESQKETASEPELHFDSTTFCIQFPDPWSKARHRRRRLVDDEFAKLLRKVMWRMQNCSARLSAENGNCQRIYLSSDREDLFEEMCSVVRRVFGNAEAKVGDHDGKECNVAEDSEDDDEPESSATDDVVAPEEHDNGPEADDKTADSAAETTPLDDSEEKQHIQITSKILSDEAISAHPFGIGTERDRVCESLHRPVWRRMFHVAVAAEKGSGRD